MVQTAPRAVNRGTRIKYRPKRMDNHASGGNEELRSETAPSSGSQRPPIGNATAAGERGRKMWIRSSEDGKPEPGGRVACSNMPRAARGNSPPSPTPRLRRKTDRVVRDPQWLHHRTAGLSFAPHARRSFLATPSLFATRSPGSVVSEAVRSMLASRRALVAALLADTCRRHPPWLHRRSKRQP